MATDVTIPLITGGAGLLGALIGSGTTLFGQWRQRKAAQDAEIVRENRDADRRKQEAKDERTRQAAEDCDALLYKVARQARELGGKSSPRLGYSGRVDSLLAELSSHSVFLPDDLRSRVDEAALVLRNADSLAPYPDPEATGPDYFHYRTTGSIAETTQQDAHLAIAAWLQGQQLPARSLEMRENLAALQDYSDFLDDRFSDRDDDWYDAIKQQFFKDHSELLPPATGSSSPDQ